MDDRGCCDPEPPMSFSISRLAELAQDDLPDLPVQIGKYRVLRKLGEGATSEVFLCHDDFHDRDVATSRRRWA